MRLLSLHGLAAAGHRFLLPPSHVQLLSVWMSPLCDTVEMSLILAPRSQHHDCSLGLEVQWKQGRGKEWRNFNEQNSEFPLVKGSWFMNIWCWRLGWQHPEHVHYRARSFFPHFPPGPTVVLAKYIIWCLCSPKLPLLCFILFCSYIL